MFKYRFLKWRTLSALKKNQGIRTSIPYRQAKNVGIIFSVEDRAKHDAVKDFIKQLELDEKKVTVLEFLPSKKENYEFLFDFFTVKDLTFWGKIDSIKADRFIESPFDYVFYVDSSPNPLIINLLARSKGHCRIGRFTESESSCFELMIQSNGSAKSLIDNMYKYTKQLK